MKTVTVDEARLEFETLFQLAAQGETVIIKRDGQRVALRSEEDGYPPKTAPPGHFADDYSPEEIAELNMLASQNPNVPLA